VAGGERNLGGNQKSRKGKEAITQKGKEEKKEKLFTGSTSLVGI